MLFRKEEIISEINHLISDEAIRIVLSLSQYHLTYPKNDNEEQKKSLETVVNQRTANINYLKSLRARITERPSEKELMQLLKEIEKAPIQVGSQTFSTGDLLRNKDLPTSLQRMKKIHDSLNDQLASLEYSERTAGVLYIGEADESGQINSPVIQKFIANSKTSNKEEFPHDTPPAIVDLQRDILVNGRNFPKFSEEAIRKEIRAFLETSKKFKNNEKAKDALCNAILKNGQGLQELFVLEFVPSDSKDYPLLIDGKSYMIGSNNTQYNWTINSEGDLCMEVELDIKSLISLTGDGAIPYIIDSRTGELRLFDEKRDEIGNCPTLIKYKASIVFDVKSSDSAYKTKAQFQASKGNPTLTEAVPRINSFNITVYSDKVHYTPQLTQFYQLDIIPQEIPGPGNN